MVVVDTFEQRIIDVGAVRRFLVESVVVNLAGDSQLLEVLALYLLLRPLEAEMFFGAFGPAVVLLFLLRGRILVARDSSMPRAC